MGKTTEILTVDRWVENLALMWGTRMGSVMAESWGEQMADCWAAQRVVVTAVKLGFSLDANLVGQMAALWGRQSVDTTDKLSVPK